MKRIVTVILCIFLFVTVVNASEKKFNDSSTPMQKLAVIEFAILPPLAGVGVGLINAIAVDINAEQTSMSY